MRVPNSSFPGSLVTVLGRLSTRQDQLQTQVATGQKLRLPEDNPTAMRRVMDLQAEGRQLQQYQSNIDFASNSATAAYSSIKGLKTIMDRATELATRADGTRSPDDLKNMGTEVNQLLEQALQVANTRQNGRYLMAGTRDDTVPFQAARDANGRIASVSYSGNENVLSVQIGAGVEVSAQVIGANSSGGQPAGLFKDKTSGADIFANLTALRDALNQGDTSAIASTVRPALVRDEDNVINQLSNNGAMQARLEAASAMVKAQGTAVDGLVSKDADADLAETMVKLSETQNAYRAALQSGSTILKESLMDYLR